MITKEVRKESAESKETNTKLKILKHKHLCLCHCQGHGSVLCVPVSSETTKTCINNSETQVPMTKTNQGIAAKR